jgi:hypothetical protein
MTENVEEEEIDFTQADQPDESEPVQAQATIKPGSSGFSEMRAAAREAQHSKVSTILTLILFGGILFTIAAVAAVYIYLNHITPRSYRLARSDGSVDTPTPPPAATPKPTPALGRTATGELIPVSADDLHVTSIALGHLHLCIVNGKRLAEGDFLQVKTPAGVTYVRLTSLEDGLAHFEYAGDQIDAKLQVTIGPKKPAAPQPIAEGH